ncbi:MAG TPA: FmdB family zinc ribbon protein [Mycobacteriales bacterium]|jgi:putative FmdB family regulatory protein|nr:FmdB family zinc ribbon protein [Mycobacteriales bacterium]
MPTYEYVCTKCGERLEAVQSFNDPPLTKCPACKGKLRKVFSAAGIVFKGSGFYKTDSRSGSKSSSSSTPKEPAAASDSSSTASASSSDSSSSSPSTSSKPSSKGGSDGGSKVA